MLENHVEVRSYWSSPVASEGAQRNLALGADLIIYNVPEGVDDDSWDFDGCIGRKNLHSILARSVNCRIRRISVRQSEKIFRHTMATRLS